ncbi:hypothetical protein [uncultured Hoeflea sp.]|uniref:hypothetical protein n=1 Tax=uncultured Hoeflea sp. TaxID=538666 RepID=UPI0026232717|nr:hypothetical protein [uncultured Hoeflea sp.]
MTHLKTPLNTAIAALIATTVLSATPCFSQEAIIGLSPHQTADDLRAQAERVIAYLVEAIDPGESALIFDADRMKLIGTFEVPDGSAYENPRAKVQANRAVLGALKRLIDAAKPDADRPAAIDMPGFLRTVRAHYPATDGKERAIIVLGSPVYDDPLAPSLSMAGGRVGNDGLISAFGHVSPYGTSDLPGTLDGDAVYFGIVPAATMDNWQVSLEHGYHVERFWTLSVEAHGGVMAYYGDDMASLFRLASDGARGQPHSQPLAPTDKLEMVRFFPDQGLDGDDEPQIPDNAEEIDWQKASNVRVRASWACETCDLDLYVRPDPRADVLYYARSRTVEGELYKDLRRGMTNGFETVVLNGTFDLEAMLIAVNLYGGKAPVAPVTATIELSVGSQTFTKSVDLNVRSGNRGNGADMMLETGTAPSAHWIVVSGAGFADVN